jgi:hypothetical protein
VFRWKRYQIGRTVDRSFHLPLYRHQSTDPGT